MLLADLPPILSEIVRTAIEEQPDLELIEVADRATGADVVFTRGIDMESLPAVLRRQPGLRVFAIEADGRETSLYELRPHRISLGDVSPQQLVDAIRGRLPVSLPRSRPI